MFAIAKDTISAEILKALSSTGLFIKCPAYKVKEKPSVTVTSEDAFQSLAFEDAIFNTRIPTVTDSLSEEELEAYAREYAEQEAASALSFQPA